MYENMHENILSNILLENMKAETNTINLHLPTFYESTFNKTTEFYTLLNFLNIV